MLLDVGVWFFMIFVGVFDVLLEVEILDFFVVDFLGMVFFFVEMVSEGCEIWFFFF